MHYKSISAQTSQEGIKCTKAKEWLRSSCPNIYTVQKGLFETLLATLFRPHNAYCIFMDSKADPGFKTIVNQLINCYKENFPNVKNFF